MIKKREYFTGDYYPSDNSYSMEIPEDFKDNQQNYYIKFKCVATNGLDANILISGFDVYCEFKINRVEENIDNEKIQKILEIITVYKYIDFDILDKNDTSGKEFHFLKVFFKNHNIRKEIITKIRNIVMNKEDDYQIFDLYEDDISTSYALFIAPRTPVIIDGIKRGFPLTKAFKTNKTLCKDMYKNKFDYRTLEFIDDFDAYLSMFFDYETVDLDNMKKSELGRVSTGFKIDRAFMGVFCFFKGREIKPFYIVAILLQDDDFLVDYKKPNENCDLIYVKTQEDFFLKKAELYLKFHPEKTEGWNNLGYDWKFTIRKLYELNLFVEFMKKAIGKEKKVEDIIKWDFKKDFVVVNASEHAIHYYLKINGTEEYDQQQMFRQNYQNLVKWRLKDILLMLGLAPKEDLEISEMYKILFNCFNNNYDKETLIEKCTSILIYCIRDCVAPKKAIEHINKITKYRLITDLTITTFYIYSHNTKTPLINNLIVNLAYQQGFIISFKYNKKNKHEDFEGGFVADPEKVFSAVPCGDLDFNSLYPNLMMQHNICFTTKIEEIKKGEEYHEISFKDVKGKIKYVRYSKEKKGLVPTILELLVGKRKQAKRDLSKYDKYNLEYVNSIVDEFKNQGDTEDVAVSKTLAFIDKNYNYYNILQDSLKKLANSIYRQFGNQCSIICDYDISSSVTKFGQKYIQMASEFMQSREISETIKEKKFIWKYTDTDSIFFRLSHPIINEIIKKYENQLLDKNIIEEEFIKVIHDIQEEMIVRTYDERSPRIVMEYEKQIFPNIFIAKKKYIGLIYKKCEYCYNNEWKDLEKYLKEKLSVDIVTEEMVNEYIETTNEYLLLSEHVKFDNLLARSTDLVKRNSTLICHFCRDTSMIVVENFVKHLYSEESKLDLNFFELNAKNNDDEDGGEMTFIELTEHRCFKYNSKGSWK
ncbi:626_t:CDS:2, partial [Cetraspora pellucida]